VLLRSCSALWLVLLLGASAILPPHLCKANLNPDAAHYTPAQCSGVNFNLEIDALPMAPPCGGIFDLNANLAGTLEVPLNAILNSPTNSSSR
jgi:hypothetical protein